MNFIKPAILATLCVCILPIAVAQKAKQSEPANKPADRLKTKWWKERHEQRVKEAKTAKVDLLFIGDSITHFWERQATDLWDEYYAPRNALNLGFSGDRTQHVLWRLQNGEMKGLTPKVAVMMIGTNNTGHSMQAANETAAGIKAIIQEIHQQSPETHVLLLGVFPRAPQPDHKMRIRNNEINAIIKDYAGEKVTFLDLSSAMLDKDGILTQKVMPDGLHPKKHGYRIWAESMEPTLKTLMGEK